MNETKSILRPKNFGPSTRTSIGVPQDEQLAQTGAVRLLDKQQKMFELQEALEQEKAELLSKVSSPPKGAAKHMPFGPKICNSIYETHMFAHLISAVLTLVSGN